MSHDSGISSSQDDSNNCTSMEIDRKESIKKLSGTEVPIENELHLHSNEDQSIRVEQDSPLKRKKGISPEHHEGNESQSENDEKSVEPVLRRSRGRPKGAKNKNPKPKPPPKPKRPKGRPRKYGKAVTSRITRQLVAKIEPISEKPPDNIFED